MESAARAVTLDMTVTAGPAVAAISAVTGVTADTAAMVVIAA